MKKETLIRIVICLLFLVMIVWLVACGAPVEAGENEPATWNVDFSYVDTAVAMGKLHQIVKCDQTGVLYAASESGTLTLLVNADGTPMLWED